MSLKELLSDSALISSNTEYSCLPGCNLCCNMHKAYDKELEGQFISWIKGFNDYEEFGFTFIDGLLVMPKMCGFSIKKELKNKGRRVQLCGIYKKRPNLCRAHYCETSEIISSYERSCGIKKTLSRFYLENIGENELENYLLIMPKMMDSFKSCMIEKVDYDFLKKSYNIFMQKFLPLEKKLSGLKEKLIIEENEAEPMKHELLEKEGIFGSYELSEALELMDNPYCFSEDTLFRVTIPLTNHLEGLAKKLSEALATYPKLSSLLNNIYLLKTSIESAKEEREKGLKEAELLIKSL